MTEEEIIDDLLLLRFTDVAMRDALDPVSAANEELAGDEDAQKRLVKSGREFVESAAVQRVLSQISHGVEVPTVKPTASRIRLRRKVPT